VSEKATVTYPIAKDEEDRWVEIKNARPGGKYFCPGCRSRFVPRLGEIRAHHFAHYPGYTGVCTGESGYHSLAKQLLAYYFDKNRQLEFSWKCPVCGKPLFHAEEVDHIGVEQAVSDGRRPDVTISFQSDKTLCGEVVFRNPLESEKVESYQKANAILLVWKIDGAVDRVPQIEFKPWCVETHLEIIRAFPGCIIYFDPEQFQPPCDHRLTPQELGLPEKFKDWWPDQWETIVEVSDSPQKVYLLDAPTGVGKTVVGVGIHRLSGKRCIYITRTKQLQSQIDFPGIVKVMMGRENYPCLKHPDDFHPGDSSSYTAANCTDSKKKPCELKDKCPYFLAKKEALASPLAVLNTSYYLTEVNGPGKFSGAELLVVDEVDSLEDELMNYIQFSVTEKQLKGLGIPLPVDPSSLQAWLDWGDMIRTVIVAKIEEHQGQLALTFEDNWQPSQLTQRKKVTQLEKFNDRVDWFLGAFDVDTWVFYPRKDEESGEREWIFKPIFISDYTDRFLWRHATQFLGMSATIFDPHIVAGTLGLQDGQGHYKRLDSPFPVKNRPIFYSPVADLTKRTMDTERLKLLPAVQALINRYPNEKILIHTVSYRLRDFLVKNLEQDRLISHTKWNREDKLEEFKDSFEPLVMLSPSFDRGVDLPQEKCRCIIICKVPYLYKGDPQIIGRMKALGGQKWYVIKAAQTLVQMSGRAVRSKDDYCDTYILDRQFGRLFSQMKHMKIATGDPIFPEWWAAAVVRKEL